MAEDDHEMRRLIRQTLQHQGYSVTCAGSGLELFDALNHARETNTPISLVISDIRMPGLSGLDILRHLRAIPVAAPVILISAFCDDDTVDEASAIGAAVVMSKPFDMSSLVTVTRHLLAESRRDSHAV